MLWSECSNGFLSVPSSTIILRVSLLNKNRNSLAALRAITFFSAITFWLLYVLYCNILLSDSSVRLLRAASILWVSKSSASFICKKSFLCFDSSFFSNSSIDSIWASSMALPTSTCKIGSASNSKSNRSLSRSLSWIAFMSPSGLGTKMGEGF